VPTVTLISDIANTRRAAYVGLDNRSAGRTAAYLIARFIGPKPAKVAMIAGSLSYRAHEEREMGFLHLFQELFPAIEVVGLREGHDEERRTTARPRRCSRSTRSGRHLQYRRRRRRHRARAQGGRRSTRSSSSATA
jgi:DNA-binding LacI/PurR family transcriptional regulator